MNTPDDMKVGTEFPTTHCGSVRVVQYGGYYDVEVEFGDGFTTTTQASNVRKGRVKNPNVGRVYGVGYQGVGRHDPRVDGQLTRVYRLWHAMMQ